MTEAATSVWPTDIALRKGGHVLAVTFEDGTLHNISAELLRVESPSAEVQGHSPDQKSLQWGKRDVAIIRVEPVGNYALRLHFSDGHNTGIYTWGYLYELGQESEALLASHLEKLAQAGLRR
jgi:DUF971 family protein